jgi:hypothetical protein
VVVPASTPTYVIAAVHTRRSSTRPVKPSSKLVLPHRSIPTSTVMSSRRPAEPVHSMVAFFSMKSHPKSGAETGSEANHSSTASSQIAR